MGDYYYLPRAKIGWSLLSKLINHLGKLSYKGELVYLFDTFELVITDPKLKEYLDELDIRYDIHEPDNTIKFIRDSAKENKKD